LLLEWKLGKLNTDKDSNDYGDVHQWCGNAECPICVIFGTSADEAGLGPTRLIVRDAILDNEYKEKQEAKDSSWTVIDVTEDKYENTINRITARANPRNFERVIAGAEFSLSMSYRVFVSREGALSEEALQEVEDEANDSLFWYVIEGLRLMERDALGGAGSRGCGQVKFLIGPDRKPLSKVTIADFPTIEEI
jgi:CRISPR-associated protein Csm3